MKQNVIAIFVDSVTWECVGKTRASVSPTPFLDSLMSESVTATKLYSHGPYTDAAKTSLLTGRNCLDDFGYYFRQNSSPITDLKLFHDAGYETYCFHYPFWIYGNHMRKYIDHMIYTAGFIFGSEWGGMFGHYYEISKTRSLTVIEYKLLSSRLQLFFEAYMKYVDDILNNPESSILHTDKFVREEYFNAEKILADEYHKFSLDPVSYIDDLNKLGKEHPIAMLKLWKVDDLISRDFHEDIYLKNKRFFKKASRNNFFANCISAFPSVKRLWWGISRYLKTKNKENLYFLINYRFLLHPFEEMRNIWGKPNWQVSNSIHTILNGGLEILKKRDKTNDAPFYMYLNTDDPHKNIAMFAYDTRNTQAVNDEINILREYTEKVGTNFKGSLLYTLSIRYVDYEIEQFCTKLKQMGLWENTTLLFLSDHGSSFTYHPLHNARVNCFDDECYHIPVLLRSPGFKGVSVDAYQNSKDILPTVCDLVGINKHSDFSGNSMLDNNRPIHNYVMTEYMGPGCPDMTSKRMWLSIRDKNYIVAYKVGIFESFEDGELTEVYNLTNDKKAYYNISHSINRSKINYLLEPLKERFNKIKEDTETFLNNMNNVI